MPAEPEPEPESARRRWPGGLGLVVASLGLAMLWGQASASSSVPRARSCVRAVMVDGQLRCDDELPDRAGALCPGLGPRSTEPLVGGDVVDTAQLCAHSEVTRGDPAGGWSRMPPDQLAALHQPVDVNRASAQELTSLPRIGPVLASRIVEGRPYANLDALRRVRGIGPATIERLRSRVVTEP